MGKTFQHQTGYIQPATITGSSSYADYAVPGKLTDRDYGTRWEPADEDKTPALTVLFDNIVAVDTMEVRFEYPWEKYYMKVEVSLDGSDWEVITDYTTNGISGSPVIIPVNKQCEFVQLSFKVLESAVKPSIWELVFY